MRNTLAGLVPTHAWNPAATSPESGFRNKVKLAVGGTLQRPTLGLTNAAGQGVDLRECGIQDRHVWEVIPDLAGFVTHAGLEPYDVAHRRGALKYLHVTTTPAGRLMLRFVVRERSHAERLAEALPALLDRLPQIDVVSANLLPEHKAVVEGDVEIPLTPHTSLAMGLDDITLHPRPGSFFQTNTVVAAALYAQASRWADLVEPEKVLDLYCGVGGFALHLAASGRRVHGVEIEPAAVASAERSAMEVAESVRPTFSVGDATGVAAALAGADLVVVNPPRRGIGAELAAALDVSGCSSIIYSSCNPVTLAEDLRRMERYDVAEARLFDMFPQTDHAEVAVMLTRRAGDGPGEATGSRDAQP